MNERQPILLVDDDEDNLYLMRTAFDMAGSQHPLRSVNNGEDAIAYLQGSGMFADRTKYPWPVVMVLDLNMPKMNGFQVLEWVRSQPVLKRLVVVILSASMRSQDVDRAYDLGATAFLVKPTDLDDLAAMMKTLCDGIHINHFPPLYAVEAK